MNFVWSFRGGWVKEKVGEVDVVKVSFIFISGLAENELDNFGVGIYDGVNPRMLGRWWFC